MITLPTMMPLMSIIPAHRSVLAKGYRVKYKLYHADDVEHLPIAFFHSGPRVTIMLYNEMPNNTRTSLEDVSFSELGYTLISFNILSKKKEQEEDNSLVIEKTKSSTSSDASDTQESYLTPSPTLAPETPESNHYVSAEVSGNETKSDDYI